MHSTPRLKTPPLLNSVILDLTMLELGRLYGNLKEHPLFDGMDSAATEQISSHFNIHVVQSGDTFIHQGEQADCLHVLLAGRCRILVDGQEVKRVGRGAVIGELGMLTRQVRAATVEAARDTIVATLHRDLLEKVTEAHPTFWRALGVCAARLASGKSSEVEAGQSGLVLTLVNHSAVDLEQVAQALERTLSGFGRTTIVSDLQDTQTNSSIERHDYLERRYDYVLKLVENPTTSWGRRSLRQADRVIWVVSPEISAPSRTPEATLTATGHLLLVHSDDTEQPTGTLEWLDQYSPVSHHHVRLGNPQDMARAARLLVGRGIGLSLAGGGARGVGHLGLVRALRETGVPIDSFTGASAGAAIAAWASLGWDDEQLLTAWRDLHMAVKPRWWKFTLPLAALMSGETPLRILKRQFGDIQIEDCWVPILVPSVDLVQGSQYVFTRGPLWRAVRATGSLPFFYPPVLHEGRVLVDSGLMNNQPWTLLSTGCGQGHIIAQDLVPGDPSTGPLMGLEGSVDHYSGWQMLPWFGGTRRLPGLADVMVASLTLASLSTHHALDADSVPRGLLWLRPVLKSYGIFAVGPEEQQALIDRVYDEVKGALTQTFQAD